MRVLMLRCTECGVKMEARNPNKLFCTDCKRKHSNEIARLWVMSNPERHRANGHYWYVMHRKRNRAWHLKNSEHAKNWRRRKAAAAVEARA